MLEPRTDEQPAQPGSILNVSRRSFLRGAGGLALGIYFAPLLGKLGDAQAASDFEPNAFVRIAPDGTVTVIAKHVEMGQGSYTGLATLVAEELDADWSHVQVEGAPADAKRYANLAFGNLQGTGGSNAMANSFEQMRKAGASARAMLVGAAAEQWKVPAEQIQVQSGVVSHGPSGHKASFGELAEAAAKQPVPADVKLKDPKDFKLIGQVQLPRKDSPSKTDGTAQFTQDVHLPDMLVAVVAHPPRFGRRAGESRCEQGQGRAGCGGCGAVPRQRSAFRWRRRAGEEHLGGAPGPRCFAGRMGREQGLQDG